MGLIQKKVFVKTTSYNIQHYINKGYECYNGSVIEVAVEDLTPGSGIHVEVSCDYCGKVFTKAYRKYLESSDSVCCDKCKSKKAQETHFKRYGVNTLLWEPNMRKRIAESCLERTGCSMPGLSEESLAKRSKTCMEKYGVIYPLNNPSILQRTRVSKSHNNTIETSKAQHKICGLLGGIENYNVGKYFVDVFIEDKNICCEYDGGGHNLQVKFGVITQEEFDKKEKRRTDFLLSKGFRVFRIVNAKDSHIDKNEIIEAYSKACCYFDNGGLVYIYDMNKKIETLL